MKEKKAERSRKTRRRSQGEEKRWIKTKTKGMKQI